jgi:hypothetical protein
MKNSYLVIFTLFLLNLSCSKQENDAAPVTIVGTWKIAKIQSSETGDYPVTGCTAEIEIEFKENLTATANEPDDDMEDGVCVDEYYDFDYSITDEYLTINHNNIVQVFNYELTNTTLKYWSTDNNNVTSINSLERID